MGLFATYCLFCLLALLLTACSRSTARSAKCRSKLHSIGRALHQYAEDHHQCLPTNLVDLVGAGYAPQWLLACPGVRHETEVMRLSAREFESDYVYWYWTNLSTAPLSSPWVHDKSIRNHGERALTCSLSMDQSSGTGAHNGCTGLGEAWGMGCPSRRSTPEGAGTADWACTLLLLVSAYREGAEHRPRRADCGAALIVVEIRMPFVAVWRREPSGYAEPEGRTEEDHRVSALSLAHAGMRQSGVLSTVRVSCGPLAGPGSSPAGARTGAPGRESGGIRARGPLYCRRCA